VPEAVACLKKGRLFCDVHHSSQLLPAGHKSHSLMASGIFSESHRWLPCKVQFRVDKVASPSVDESCRRCGSQKPLSGIKGGCDPAKHPRYRQRSCLEFPVVLARTTSPSEIRSTFPYEQNNETFPFSVALQRLYAFPCSLNLPLGCR